MRPRWHVAFVTLVLASGMLAGAQPARDSTDPARNRLLYGFATLTPADAPVAGSWGTWTLTLTVGRLGIDDGGQIMLVARGVSDWAPFQTTSPGADQYVTVRTTGRAHFNVRYDNRRAWKRPWYRGLIITVEEGYLQQGDEVVVTLGDRSEGGRGARVQTPAETLSGFRFVVDPFGTGQPVPVLASPQFAIVAGPPASLELVAPTEATVGNAFWLQVRAKDVWGNAAESFRGTVEFQIPAGVTGLPPSYAFTSEDRGFHRFEGLRAARPGTYRVRGRDGQQAGMDAESNPVVALAAGNVRPLWADLHGQSGESVGLGTVGEYYRYARGFAAVDVAAHQANDFQVTREVWDTISAATRAANEPGRFVTFAGYEWSGNTANGGDHNVLYFDDGQTLHHSSRAQMDEDDVPEQPTDQYTIRDLADVLAGRRSLLIPHIGGRPANLEFFDARLMPGIEVYSVHGQFEWFLEDALTRGLKVGVFAASDDHMCKPGEAAVVGERFWVHGGLTCLYASDLTREAVWTAIQRRRFYATTGERIRLRFTSGDHWMGEEFDAGEAVSFAIDVDGTTGIERVDVFRGIERVYRHAPSPLGPSDRLRVVWSGAETTGRARVTTWNGGLRLSDSRIRVAKPYRLDSPAERIAQPRDGQVTWESRTAGDEDGVILDLEAAPDAVLTFETKPASFAIPLRDLSTDAREFPAGGLGRKVTVRRVADAYPRQVAFTWTDTAVPRGTSAYWIRVQQQDGAVAWASPMFVTRR